MSVTKETPYARPKYSKPDMEKRRRARMNASLDELRNILLSTLKMEGSRQSKLEKADILEMTVEHLRSLQRQRMSALPAGHEDYIHRYRQGYNECASEITRYLMSCSELDPTLRLRILAHMEVRARSTNQLLHLKSEAASRAQAHQLPPYSSTPATGGDAGANGVVLSHPPRPETEVKPPTDTWQPSGSSAPTSGPGSQRVYAPVSLPFQTTFPSPFSGDSVPSYVAPFSTAVTSSGGGDAAVSSGGGSGYCLAGGRLGHFGEYPPWMPMTPPESAAAAAAAAAAHYAASYGKGVLPGEEVWRPW